MSENNATRSNQVETEPNKKPKPTPTQRTAPPKQPQTQSVPSINVNKLGYFLDGWAEIVENMGDKELDVIKSVRQQLLDRKMPDITTNGMYGYVNQLSSERRVYIINTTSPGATTTVYIAKHGKDLFASWRTFIRPVLNLFVLIITFGICAFLGIITGGVRQSGGFLRPAQPTFSFTGWIGMTIVFLIIASFLLAVVGRVMKGNFLAYFFIEPNQFDSEDITAMSLTVHKTVLRALDNAGIDVSKLRLKQEFKGGRRGEIV